MSAAVAGAVLAGLACFVVHLVLIGGVAPVLAGIEQASAALASGRRPAPFRRPDLPRRGQPTGTLGETAAVVALAASAVAALLVPSFAILLPLGAAGGLVAVLFLLLTARIGRLVACAGAAPADAVEDFAGAVPFLALFVPAWLLAALLAAEMAGSTRLDLLAASAGAAPGAPRALLILSLLLVAFAESGERSGGTPPDGRVADLLALERLLRFAVLLATVAVALPPAVDVGPSGGILRLALAIPVFLGKTALLATVVGLAHPFRSAFRPATLLAASSLLCLLGAVLVAVGQTVE